MSVLAAGLLILVSIGRVQELFPALIPLRLGFIALVLNLLVMLATLDVRDLGFKMRILPLPKLVLAILGLAVITVPFSVWPGNSLQFIMDSLARSVFAFFVFLHVMKEERAIKGLVWAGLLSAFLLGFTGLFGYAGGRLQVSATYDPNDLAYIMNCFIPFAYFLSKTGGKLNKVFCYVLLGLMVVTVISTASRGGFVGLVSVFTIILFKEKQHKLKILVLSAFVGLIAMSFAGPEYWQRMGTIFDQNDYNYEAGTGRIELWKRGIGMMIDNPIIGVGIGQYRVAEGLQHLGESGWKWSTAHNSYLQIGVDLALPGLIAYLLMIVKSVAVARKLQASPGPFDSTPFLAATTRGLEVGFYGYCVCSIFLSQAYSPVLFYFLALVTALYSVSLKMQGSEAQEKVVVKSSPHACMRRPDAQSYVKNSTFGVVSKVAETEIYRE
ncbi:O-antigen ligase family protein [Desulfomicrobium sp. ZS1]|uniref:O-antigen ligase family protein n=1 Tax=Desulfomicrobium sp. ZS1 TaxID=2952228 RepID=UPI0020B22B00|nr:O-antigen ligase family protein [Desulfomicrobium sp. ZS1]UTF50707.1 O-antigen ligase family protein [Desulfomicrobium sp. ZS1]